ncbi:MAG: 5-methyltetrahydrofolate--homocysteine methyltransferase [Bacteroidaceae bacterium]|nr:5-methyltetrahydrofolate--homocysteine methyltransferase [Bacteroidaceae bacterium]
MIDRHYVPSDLLPLIDWPHFLFAWGFKGKNQCSEEAEMLKTEALTALSQMQDGGTTINSRVCILDAGCEGDDILIFNNDKTFRLPCLRQQRRDKGSDFYRCLADYLAPVGRNHPVGNRLGLFATAVHSPALEQAQTDYQRMLFQTLADRLAEATAERVHHEALHHEWGKPLSEPLYGIRPAVGYPSLPDLSANFLLDKILHFESLGIRLTENGMMIPHAAISGLIFAHHKALYFNLGAISEEQFLDYARRKNVTPQWLQKFIPNIVKTK